MEVSAEWGSNNDKRACGVKARGRKRWNSLVFRVFGTFRGSSRARLVNFGGCLAPERKHHGCASDL